MTLLPLGFQDFINVKQNLRFRKNSSKLNKMYQKDQRSFLVFGDGEQKSSFLMHQLKYHQTGIKELWSLF